MKDDTFNYLWSCEIEPKALEIEKEMLQRYSAREKYGFSVVDLKEYKKSVFSYYQATNQDLKNCYFNNSQHDSSDTNLIDIHKVVSCFCKTFVKNKVFRFKVDSSEMPIWIILSNYTFAFCASIGILYQNMLAHYKRHYYEKYRILKNERIVFPKTNPGHDPYVVGRIKTLALNDIYNTDFDLLAFADMFFWIEEFNKKYYGL